MLRRCLTRFRPLTRSRCRRTLYSDAGSTANAYSSGPSDPNLVNPTAKKSSSFLSFGLFSAVAGALGTAGYATYAYTADEVDEKTKAFRSSINHGTIDAESTLEKLQHHLYSAAMTVPVKAVDLYLVLRRSIEEHVQELAEPLSDKLLPDMDPAFQQMRIPTLVLDLRETLIYSEWKRETGWRTFKRPGLDDFLQHLAQFYEIVVYTDEPYIEEMIPKLQPNGVQYFLTRPATKYLDGKHYRDLSKLNRDPSRILYVSGHALESCLQHENCVSIKPWKKEANDTTLIDLIPFLEFVALQRPEDMRPVLASYVGKDIPSEFIRRHKEIQRHMQEKKHHTPRFWRH